LERVNTQFNVAVSRVRKMLKGSEPSPKRKKTKGVVYAVARGRQKGLFSTWTECTASISGYSGAVYRKFSNTQDALAWLDASEPATPASNALVVYADGACAFNQDRSTACAGVGVWFGDGDQRNVSEPLVGVQTNQRAELTALIRALQAAPQDVPLHVFSDSEYVVLGVNFRLEDWAKNGFPSVKNTDLWQLLHNLLKARSDEGPVSLEHIRGHSGVYGNEMADALAVAGSKKT
jgi:ribonuclease HI